MDASSRGIFHQDILQSGLEIKNLAWGSGIVVFAVKVCLIRALKKKNLPPLIFSWQ